MIFRAHAIRLPTAPAKHGPICPPGASGRWAGGPGPWGKQRSGPTGAVGASGGLLAGPGHPDRPRGRARSRRHGHANQISTTSGGSASIRSDRTRRGGSCSRVPTRQFCAVILFVQLRLFASATICRRGHRSHQRGLSKSSSSILWRVGRFGSSPQPPRNMPVPSNSRIQQGQVTLVPHPHQPSIGPLQLSNTRSKSIGIFSCRPPSLPPWHHRPLLGIPGR
jgi:hypothetical protein